MNLRKLRSSHMLTVVQGSLIRNWQLISYPLRNPKKWLPKIIYFSINSVCNMKCKMCDIGQREKDFQFAKNLCISQEIELPLSVFRKVIDEVLFFMPSVSIVATEPLLYSEIISASRYVKERGLNLSITTNGLLLKKYVEPLLEIGLDDLWISLDGTRELNDSIRGVQGSFDNAIRGIRLSHYFKKEMKSKKPNIHINFTISDLNCHILLDFAKEMIEEKVDSINFSHLNFVTGEMAKRHNDQFGLFCKTTPSSVREVNPRKIDFESLHEQIKEILRLFPKGKVTFTPHLRNKRLLCDYYLRPDLRVGKKRCLVPWTTASIQPNGDMVVLSRCFNYVLGNLMRQNFLEIWECQRYQSFRRKLWENKYFPACTRCCGIL